MNNVRLLNRCIWCSNLLLAAAIVIFASHYLFRSSENVLIKDIHLSDESPHLPVTPPGEGDDSLITLPNPIVKPNSNRPQIADPTFRAVLKGTLPSGKTPKRGVAFLRSLNGNVELIAYLGEEILYDERPFDEFRGWTMAAVAKGSAVFVNTFGKRAELAIDQAVSPALGAAIQPGPGLSAAPGKSRIGQPYNSAGFKSRLLATTESRQVWGMDQDELEWVAQNVDQIVNQDFQAAPYAGGGLRLESMNPGSIGASRGLLAGDVLREVNGQPLNNIADVRSLMNNSAMAQLPGLRLTIERAGKPLVIEYRPLPK